MKFNWKFFFPAAFFAGWALVSNGVPILPVMLGIAAIAAMNLWNQHRVRSSR